MEPHDFAAALEAQEPFLARLARSLIADEHIAADVVQDTMLSAWKAGSGSDGPSGLEPGRLRAWLATALRRKSVSWRRSAAHHHERSTADVGRTASQSPQELAADPVGAPERVALRLERQALLHGAVQALPEVYRTALVLRFQDAMAASAIADELGVPVATVRSRIQRGLQKLRSELDRQCEEAGATDPRSTWLAALTPLAFPRVTVPTAVSSATTSSLTGLAGVLVMKKMIVVWLAVLVAAGVALRAKSPEEADRPREERASDIDVGEAPALEAAPALVGRTQAPTEAGVSPSDRDEPAAAAPAATAAEFTTVSGRALLVDGSLLAGVDVTARRDLTLGAQPLASTTTDDRGDFSLRLERSAFDEPVSLLVASEFDVPNGAMIENVAPGANGLKFRVDALLVRVFPEDSADLSGGAQGRTGDALLLIESKDPDSVTGGFRPFKYHTSTEGESCRLLRPGFEYLFTVTQGEFGAEEWTAVVPEGLRAGVYEFPLRRRHQELASYTAQLTGEPLGEGERLWISLVQRRDTQGRKVKGKSHGRAHFKASDSTVTRDNCLPGTSFVSTNVTSRGEPSVLYVTNQFQSVELAAGQDTEFSLNLARGGRFSVHVVRADGVVPEEPLLGLLSFTYVEGGPEGALGEHHAVGQMKKTGRRGRWSMAPFIELGETYLCQDALPPGTVEVSLSCNGKTSQTSTLTIVEGETTEWKVEL